MVEGACYGKWRGRITEGLGDEGQGRRRRRMRGGGVGVLIIEIELELARGCLVVVDFENVSGVG